MEYPQHGNVVELLTRHWTEDKGGWGQPKQVLGQERSVVESYQFQPSGICGIYTNLWSKLTGDFARKGDTSEFSFKWERRGRSHICPRARRVTLLLACCARSIPLVSYPECTDTLKSNPGLPASSPTLYGNCNTDLSKARRCLLQKSTLVRSRPIVLSTMVAISSC